MSEQQPSLIYPRLQFAYLLQFAIWGSWSYALGAFPGISGSFGIFKGVGGLYSAFALGALFSPLIGPIADSKFAAQKVLGFLHIVCGIALLACGNLCGQDNIAYAPLLSWMFLAGLTYMPSIPLINAVVFKHIPNKNKSPFVFIFGTVGWILINLLVGKMQGGSVANPIFFFLGGGCAIFLGIYSFTLPNTPPAGAASGDFFGLKALALFKRADFSLFVLCAFCVGIFGSNFYFPMLGQYLNEALGIKDTASFGTLNQVSEIVFMAALAFAVARIGLKWVLVCGLAAWAIRYGLFSTCDRNLAIVGILLHGLAYAFLYTAAYMFGDRVAPDNLKASVQSLLAFLLLGVGQVLSGVALEELKEKYPLEAAAPAPVVEEAAAEESAFFSFSNAVYAQEADQTALNEAAAPVADLALPLAQEAAAPAEEKTVADEAAELVQEGVDLVKEEVAKVEESAVGQEAAKLVDEGVDLVKEGVAKVEESAIGQETEKLVGEGVDLVKEGVAKVEESAIGQEAAALVSEVENSEIGQEAAALAVKIEEAAAGTETSAAPVDWKNMLRVPSLFCLVFTLIFLLFGKEPKAAEASVETTNEEKKSA